LPYCEKKTIEQKKTLLLFPVKEEEYWTIFVLETEKALGARKGSRQRSYLF
jgi:hypothetical protein